MAEAGTGQSCGTWTSDLVPKKKEGEEENMYNAGLMEMLIVPFGKGVTTTLGWSFSFHFKQLISKHFISNNLLILSFFNFYYFLFLENRFTNIFKM